MRACVVGASGFIGGELLRILLRHRELELACATSRRFKGEYVYRVHPNLRGFTGLRFVEPTLDAVLKNSDVVFLALPHGESLNWVPKLYESGVVTVDLTADFRLRDPKAYEYWYGFVHPYPDLLAKSVYGQPELHREELKGAKLIASPGCMATASTLMLAPLAARGMLDGTAVVDAMIGSSGAGAEGGIVDMHSHRTNVVRPYRPVNHRHIAEIEQELARVSGRDVRVAFTPHAVNLVRGIFATGHVFVVGRKVEERDLWQAYRSMYGDSPFVRIVKDRSGIQRYPNVKYVIGTNIVDLGFEIDDRLGRIVAFAAMDNLVRGGAGQAVQALNIAVGFPETEGLMDIPPNPL